MLSSFKAQLAFPTGTYTKSTGTVDALQRGSSLNQSVYVIDPASLATPLPGVTQMQHSVSVVRRNPGQNGSNRGQVLTQAVLLDANGRPHIISFNTTLTATNYFVPPAGVAVNLENVAKAVAAVNIGYILNPADATSYGQDTMVDYLFNGIMP